MQINQIVRPLPNQIDQIFLAYFRYQDSSLYTHQINLPITYVKYAI